MATSKFIKTKSNYVIKDKHQSTSKGDIFERDFMTISGSDGMSPDEEQSYRSSNFKFTVRSGINGTYKHSNNEWIDANEEGIYCENPDTISKDTRIILNPDYQSITDFAYYGSAVDMVKSALVDIALRFPAELYFSEEKSTIEGKENYFVISNDFGIDIYSDDVDDTVENPLRYLSKSYHLYEPWWRTGKGQECECMIRIYPCTGGSECAPCGGNGLIANVEIELGPSPENEQDYSILAYVEVYRYDGQIYYLYNNPNLNGVHLRPKEPIIESFYDSLDDFEKVLLNRDSKPKYTAVFDTPYETDEGYFTYKKKYSWPCKYGWNPDLLGAGYETYVNDLIDLAQFQDEYNSNNIWRSMTHEAIKNLDWTFTKINGDDTQEFETIDVSKVEPILKIYGRQYDDLKRKIDVIAKSGNVTLDRKNNVPDYFLDDELNLSGWETTSMVLEPGKTTLSALYPGISGSYDSYEVNSEFLRRLKVFSPYIFSLKGTRRGIETLLSVFGFKRDDDYEINEEIVVAHGEGGSNSYPKFTEIADINKCKYNYVANEGDELCGLPVISVNNDYVIPWYDKNKKYDGDLYFQQSGGWGAHKPDYSMISDGDEVLYDDTVRSIRVVNTVNDLIQLARYSVRSGDICYVKDITMGVNEAFSTQEAQDASNYFLLVDDEYINSYGEVITDDGSRTSGWTIVTREQVEDVTTGIGFKIAYLESIVDVIDGNNPHSGDGKYDMGNKYIENMLFPFLSTPDDDFVKFDNYEDFIERKNRCRYIGLNVVDNLKCWHFSKSYNNTPWKNEENNMDNHLVDRYDDFEDEYVLDTDYTRENLFNNEVFGNNYQVPASYSLINTKKLSITFRYDEWLEDGVSVNYKNEFIDFVKNKVLFYLKQIIPATTVFEYSIISKNE